ncbi:MAG: hypothetical protein J7L46_01770, partial [Bacteroidales bacterium]|nr:hypothetical protein [Bacteroidales bacterium]
MRKFTLLALMLAIGFASFAQRATQKSLMNANVRQKTAFKTQKQNQVLRNVGDTIWYNDLGTPAEWSIYNLNSTTYDWVIGTAMPSGTYSTGQTISSTTVANGFAMFDSDNYGDVAMDACIEFTGTIDCSTFGNVAVTAQQSYRFYSAGSQCFVEISTDGTTWTSYPINTAVAGGATEENPFSVNVSATAANQATVHVRIRWSGQYEYAWMFDDIAVVEGADYELVGQAWIPQFYGAGWYSKMPKSNHTPLTYFSVPISNNGGIQLTGLNMTVVIDDGGTEVYNQNTTTTVSGNTFIDPAGLDTLYDDVAFDPDTLAYHMYTVNMAVDETETDENPANNVLANPYSFEITDLQIARATTINRWLGIAGYTGSVTGDVFGTIVYLPNPDTVASMDLFLRADAAALAGGASVTATLYVDDAGWVEVIASDPYDITVADTASAGHFVTLNYAIDGFSEIISGGWYLIGLVSNFDPASEVVEFGADHVFPHDYQNSVNLSINGSWYYTSSGVPAFTLNMLHVVGVNTQEAQAGVSVYPNPASTEIHVD